MLRETLFEYLQKYKESASKRIYIGMPNNNPDALDLLKKLYSNKEPKEIYKVFPQYSKEILEVNRILNFEKARFWRKKP